MKLYNKLEGHVYSVALRQLLLYGCETWSLRIEDVRSLEVFDYDVYTVSPGLDGVTV